MKFITYSIADGKKQAGMMINDNVYSIEEISEGKLPHTMRSFIEDAERNLPILEEIVNHNIDQNSSIPVTEVNLHAPLGNPNSVRDFMAFEDHIVNASKTSGIQVHPNWYKIPAFYFTNHTTIHDPNEGIERPPGCEKLDYELEIAIVIGKEGKNISVDEADEYIFGYTIFNDWSARDLQLKEMPIGLGPAKGKDFATSIGPCIVTPKVLEPFRENKGFDLEMTASVNGKVISRGNFKNIYYSFNEMIAQASSGTTLYPGDIIGSGTVGTGCLLEFGEGVHPWLQDGDEVELTIEQIGVLRNTIKK
ncbi:fumarylacetoacetate hydrolase family protein [Pseudogracilibacillus auburnensis]|uniref:Fumarylacetoacetate hydrolase n=1 Tax=Pseudogracilibacillus auburnensis TaxID=1494959 RepID=A0A2V3W8Q7_9BACI|nr:fumarylacetoacetate hydrolase family protein [Pseudogracilibacillus auburnensis]MBO1001705.1 fumarylacetoacetate hydrolase family protein [Pseudogracilibacillus auburnensis]PXW89371.1 fumarylacetoacetate hydrolase [Pseudogracilibacillus auburnensis]